MLNLSIAALCLVALWAVPDVRAEDCPAFGDWLPWTDQCMWFPLANYRNGIEAACQTTINATRMTGTAIPLPEGFQIPNKCGHCSFKMRCRKRDRKEGCYSLDLEKKDCDEFGDVCTVQKHPRLGCKWTLVIGALKNCANKPDIPEWRRDALLKFAKGLPDGNCIEKDGQCKCCCHPYRPSEDGMKCEKETEKECAPFGDYTPWSKCLWHPMENAYNEVRDHCQLRDVLKNDMPKNLIPPLPEGFQMPDKCGYCSFKVRCRKRPQVDGCFSVDGDKRVCGPSDCPTCGNICTMPKIEGGCDAGRKRAAMLAGKMDAVTKAMPYWRQRGYHALLRHLPYPTCKEVGDKCKCCCHPYEPNEDATACVPTAMCSIDPSH